MVASVGQGDATLSQQDLLTPAPAPRTVVARLIAQRYGRVLDGDMAEMALERLGRPGEEPEATAQRLVRDPEAHEQDLIRMAAVGETWFFRDPLHFRLLEEEVLPRLLRDLSRPIVAWVAGCSTGEEAYSLAIAARRVLGDEAPHRIRILATDLNSAYIQRARAGLFLKRSFRGTTLEDLAPWHDAEPDGYRVKAEVREMVTFATHNLVPDEGYQTLLEGQADIVLCRNVLAYFAKDTCRSVNRKLAACVAPGGILLLGPAETVLHDAGALRLEQRDGLFYYIRPADSVPGSMPPDMPLPRAVRAAEFRRATGFLGATPRAPYHGGTGPLQPLPFRAEVTEEPSPDEGLLGEALMLIDVGNLGDAVVLCQAALEEDPCRPAAHFLLGLARRLQGSYQEAVHLFRAAAYLQPDDWLAPFHLAESYRSLDRWDEAIREYRSCLARMDAGQVEPAPALLGGFSLAYFRKACERHIEQLGEILSEPSA